MKNRFKRFLSITTVSATGTLIACIVWYGVYCLSGHREILHFWIPYMVLPEILSIGVLAGAVTELVLPPKDMEKWEGMLRLVVHYVLITLGGAGMRVAVRLVRTFCCRSSGNVPDECGSVFLHIGVELSDL